MSYVYWAITGQYSIINDPITGFVNTSRFTTLVDIILTKLILILTKLCDGVAAEKTTNIIIIVAMCNILTSIFTSNFWIDGHSEGRVAITS